ncbi:MAG: dynamin family protein [Pseudomonadota bacterium]|nr:dynamin family protein [Pseudomonadota bacterium]
MTNSLFSRLAGYRRWSLDLIRFIGEYQDWAERHGFGSSEDDLRIYELIDSLKSDSLTVAVVGEVSRGKTALINALFFANANRQLLPSDAGRTTMCPMELLYDERQPPSLRLLPMETRKSPLTIAELKRTPIQWTTVELDPGSPKDMAAALQEIARTRSVSFAEAKALGFSRSQGEFVRTSGGSDDTTEIPVWRHAIVNYPHPLLKTGLVILDTPGLNSPGMEPELTLNMLPAAQTVMFVLGADTGVTRSDLAIWNDYVRTGRGACDTGCFALLNKIDILWDDLRTSDEIQTAIEQQVLETARVLGIARDRVFPVSAQKGLIAKIKADFVLAAKSGLPALEAHLAEDLVPARESYLRGRVDHEIGDIVRRAEALVAGRLADTDDQIGELRSLGGKSQDVIQALTTRLQTEKASNARQFESFQSARSILSDQIGILLGYLDLEHIDRLIADTRRDMQGSWTTLGIKAAMARFFGGTEAMMDRVNKQVQQIRGLVETMYVKLDTAEDRTRLRPVGFSLLAYRSELRRLQDDAETFRNSPAMVLTEQHFVIDRFFIILVSRARDIFERCHGGAKAWGKSVMMPMMTRIREHRMLMEQRLHSLGRIRDNLESLGDRIVELEATRRSLADQRRAVKAILEKISPPTRCPDGEKKGPEEISGPAETVS